MRRIAGGLLRKFHVLDRDVRSYGYFQSVVSIVINVLLFGVKYYYGVKTGSIALKADSFDTLADALTSVLLIAGFYFTFKPPDLKHPFGHGRMEKVLSLVLATFLCFIGYEFFVKSLQHFLHPTAVEFSLIAVAVLGVSIFFKELIYSVSLLLYEKSGYHALKTEAQNHRSDSLVTLVVIIDFFAFKAGFTKGDGLLGMAIACLIAFVGIRLVIEAGSFLLGEAPHPEVEDKIRKIVLDAGGKNIHHIHVHDYSGKLAVTLHIRMAKNTPLEESHAFTTRIESEVKRQLPDCDLTVHCEPERD